MDKPKKTIKNLRDIEKLMQLMQKNRISSIDVDGVVLQINSFQSDIQKPGPQLQGRSEDEDILFFSS